MGGTPGEWLMQPHRLSSSFGSWNLKNDEGNFHHRCTHFLSTKSSILTFSVGAHGFSIGFDVELASPLKKCIKDQVLYRNRGAQTWLLSGGADRVFCILYLHIHGVLCTRDAVNPILKYVHLRRFPKFEYANACSVRASTLLDIFFWTSAHASKASCALWRLDCQVFNMENLGLDVYVRLGVPQDNYASVVVSSCVVVMSRLPQCWFDVFSFQSSIVCCCCLTFFCSSFSNVGMIRWSTSIIMWCFFLVVRPFLSPLSSKGSLLVVVKSQRVILSLCKISCRTPIVSHFSFKFFFILISPLLSCFFVSHCEKGLVFFSLLTSSCTTFCFDQPEWKKRDKGSEST